MIAALIAILFLGGGIEDAVLDYVQYMRGTVKEVVADDERRADARATLNEMKKLTKAHSKSNQKTFKSLLGVMGEMGTEPETVDALWDDYFQTVDSYNERMIDLRFELRDTLTREEWEQMFADSSE
jgi:hypothetical protein